MSGRDLLGGEGSELVEDYLPGEDYQTSARINWRVELPGVAFILAIGALTSAVGLDEVWRRYVPVWVIGPVFVAYGLFYILRPARVADRAPALVLGSFAVLIGVLLSLSFLF